MPSRKATLRPFFITRPTALILPVLMPCKKLVLSDMVAMPSSFIQDGEKSQGHGFIAQSREKASLQPSHAVKHIGPHLHG